MRMVDRNAEYEQSMLLCADLQWYTNHLQAYSALYGIGESTKSISVEGLPGL